MLFKKIYILASLLAYILCSFKTYARDRNQFQVGENVQVLSDKAYRHNKGNRFEAIGNVIINYLDKSIYGEKASMSVDTGDMKVVGNVRYIDPMMTFFGSSMFFNFKTNEVEVQNARILTDSYVVLGKSIKKLANGIIVGKDSEYTTCRDCPESWSIYGKEVEITVGEYIRIWHAYVKIKGVVGMYVPYLVLPIKKNRETGLLFPSFGFNFNEGTRFRQPWFWNINKSTDMTLTPSYWGKRGVGTEIQARKVFSGKSWVEFDSLLSLDRIYSAENSNPTGVNNSVFRYFSTYEQHYSTNEFFNHHLYFSWAKDVDTLRDFDFFSSDKIFGPNLGGEGFFDFRLPWVNSSIEGSFKRNIFTRSATNFDNEFVQIAPKVSMRVAPFNLIQTDYPFIKKIGLDLGGDYTVFKQNHGGPSADGVIRNVNRLNLDPSFFWNFGEIGPVSINLNGKYDYQYYKFPYDGESTYYKSGLFYETEASFSIEKIFGLAYKKNIPTSQVTYLDRENKEIEDKRTIGKIKKFSGHFEQDYYEQIKRSYWHLQVFNLKHHFLSDQKTSGNLAFHNQISREDGNGQLDHLDAIRTKEHLITNSENRKSIPKENSLEFQWNNSLIVKEPVGAKNKRPYEDNRYLLDNFNYGKVFNFNVSQGYDFSVKSNDIKRKLTRLKTDFSIGLKNSRLKFTDYYFYSSDSHIFNTTFSQSFDALDYKVSYSYDGVSSPAHKVLNPRIDLKMIPRVKFFADYEFDFNDGGGSLNSEKYGALYSPANNCWKLDLNFSRTYGKDKEQKFSFNLFFNLNNNNFRSFSE